MKPRSVLSRWQGWITPVMAFLLILGVTSIASAAVDQFGAGAFSVPYAPYTAGPVVPADEPYAPYTAGPVVREQELGEVPYAPYTAGPVVREEKPYAPYTAGPVVSEQSASPARIGQYLRD